MMTSRKRKYIFFLSILAFLSLSSAVLFYSQGYSLDRNFSLHQTGGIYIGTPISDSEIFVNNTREKTSGLLNRGLFLSNIKAGEYSVLVAKDGFWPWAKNVEIKSGLVTEVRAIMLPENPKGELILKGNFTNIWASPQHNILILEEQKNSSYRLSFYLPKENLFLTNSSLATEKILTFTKEISNIIWEKDSILFKSNKGPVSISFNLTDHTATASFLSSPIENILATERTNTRNDEKIWWEPETNKVFIDWLKDKTEIPYYLCEDKNCQLPIQLFQGRFPIKNIEFFPGRKDVIILAVGNGVYALEVDGRNGRLAYPIYKGKSPTFTLINNEENIYVLDDNSIIKVYLK